MLCLLPIKCLEFFFLKSFYYFIKVVTEGSLIPKANSRLDFFLHFFITIISFFSISINFTFYVLSHMGDLYDFLFVCLLIYVCVYISSKWEYNMESIRCHWQTCQSTIQWNKLNIHAFPVVNYEIFDFD